MSGVRLGPSSSSKVSFASKPSTYNIDLDFYKGTSNFKYPNGDEYDGEFCAHRSGVVWKEGKGTYITNDGQSYYGNWYNDRLVEGDVVQITFKDGTIYEGALEKYKFKGASFMTLPGNLKLVLEFVDNKPSGNIILLDTNGRPWYGKPEGTGCILYQENIYFENIPASRGKALSRHKHRIKAKKTSTPKYEKEVDMVELEKRVFKKTEKLKEDYDFENSEWYQNYINFKKKQQIVMGKIRRGLRSQLTDEEYAWNIKYETFKDKYNKVMHKRKMKPNDPVDLSLIHTFYSEEYQASKPDFVMYPTIQEDSEI